MPEAAVHENCCMVRSHHYVGSSRNAFHVEALLISAPLDITAVSNPTLEFKHRQPMFQGYNEELFVAYRTSPSDSWHVLAMYQIGFDAISHGGDGVYVDDVWVGNNADGVVEQQAIEVAVMPNPTSGKITVNVNISEGNVAVFDMLGKQVMTDKIIDGIAEFDLSELTQGVYFVKISDENSVKTVKVLLH